MSALSYLAAKRPPILTVLAASSLSATSLTGTESSVASLALVGGGPELSGRSLTSSAVAAAAAENNFSAQATALFRSGGTMRRRSSGRPAP